MPVKERGNSWEAAVSKRGRRWRFSFNTKAEADTWEKEALAALARGEDPKDPRSGSAAIGSGMTLEDLFEYTVKNRWKSKSYSLIRNARTCVDTIGPRVRVADVDMQSIDRAIQIWTEQGNAGATINRKLASLSTMLTEAQRLGVIVSKPHLRRQKESEHRLRWFSKDEEKDIVQFFRHIGQHDMADLCIVAADTGLRLGTLLGLDHKDLEINPEPQKSYLRISGAKMKNGKEHHIPLTRRARDILAPRVSLRPNLFTITYFSVQHYWRVMRESLGKAGDEQFVFHVFRHTFCSRLVQRGVPIEVVQKLAGHETLQMTMRYAKLAPRNLNSAIDVLEDSKDG